MLNATHYLFIQLLTLQHKLKEGNYVWLWVSGIAQKNDRFPFESGSA